MASAISEALLALRERVNAVHGPEIPFRYDRRPVGRLKKVVGKTGGGKIIAERHDAYLLIALDEKGDPLPRVTPVEYFPDIHDAEPRQPD